jgi:hypothetical protein
MDWLTALITLAPSIVAIATLIFAYLQNRDNNRRQIQQQREQMQHEEKKAQIESEATKQRQMKERIENIYASAISSLAKLTTHIQQSVNVVQSPKEITVLFGEAQNWLSLLVISYYGEKQSKEFEDFYRSVITFSQQDGLQGAEHLRRLILEFAKNDPRLK